MVFSSKEQHFYILCAAGLWSFCFFVSGWAVSGADYYDPPMEGDGFYSLFSINTEITFTTMVSAITMLAHTGYGLYLWKKGGNQIEYTTYTGFTICLLIFIFNECVTWGGQVSLQHEFNVHGHTTESGRSMMPVEKNLHTFRALTAFASLTFITDVGLLYTLFYYQEELTRGANYSSIDLEGSGGNYSTGFIGGSDTGPQSADADKGTYSDL